MIFLLFFIFLTSKTHEVATIDFAKNVNTLIKDWIAQPDEQNYRQLNFYMRANKARDPISDKTENGLVKKLENASLSNQFPKKAATTLCLTGGTIFFAPELCGCALIGCTIRSGDMLRTCHQDNKPALVEELKSTFKFACEESRKPNKLIAPMIMTKDEV